ncbi:nuclear transport factor 2 family protein [Actinoallomurus purpureus]|uniref:nuclear transport factor 2 family protein n=1 Tax=Actinoallomurus purpureus TaxID=478114 RepID=UPI002092A331|nr:nuclear transport factor 2 family protein [Actinoallomurus purpureus]MCO6005208.1 nuclear transport factor 2 family protein [Actinoallomurus purpureus]
MDEQRSTEGPLEVLERRRRVLLARDMDAFADLFAADGLIEMPFAAKGLPARLEGREAIREFSARTRDMPFEIMDLRTRQVHRTSDPEVVIVELTTVGRVTTTGEPFEVPCIQVFRIHDGRILLFRDYVGAHTLPDLTVV